MSAIEIMGTSFQSRAEFKAFCKGLTTSNRKDIIKQVESIGVTWKRSPEYKLDWMRCAMAIGERIDKGDSVKLLKIDLLFKKMGLKTRAENNAYIIGEGVKMAENRWGKLEIEAGCVQFLGIEKKPRFGPGNWVKLGTNFADREKVKSIGCKWGGQVSPEDKHWYIPFKNFLEVIKIIKNVEIVPSIAPTFVAVLQKAKEDDLDRMVATQNTVKTESPVKDWDADIDVSDFVLPKGMKPGVEPFVHQKKGFKFTIKNERVILGLAVGLGKTLTAIMAIAELIHRKDIKRAIVVSPASVKFNWQAEIEEFSKLKTCVIESSEMRSTKKAAEAWRQASKAQVIIINYDMLRKANIRDRLHRLAPDCIIADEAHKLKNNTQQTNGFKKAWEKARYVWFLSATPFPNGKPKETFNMLNHIRPDRLGPWRGRNSFGSRFVEWEKGTYGSTPTGLRNIPELQKEMADVVFVRTQHSPDVSSSLPKERHNTFYLDMEPEQKNMYNAIALDIVKEIAVMQRKGLSAASVNVLAKMKRLEQVAIDPDMLCSGEVDLKRLYPKEEWAVNTIVEHLEDEKNRGMVVFCDMLLPLNKVRTGLIENGVQPSKIAYITGDIKNKERTEVQNKMKRGEVQVVLCTSAAEEGVNLQHGAHTMIHLDVPWVPKSITQREGRVLRQGQPNPFSQFLTPVIKGTVEDTKREKLGLKVSTIEALLGEGSAGSSVGYIESEATAEKLTLNDIKAILRA